MGGLIKNDNILYLPIILILALTFSLLISPSTFAIDPVTVSAGATVTVGAACSLSSVVDTEHTATINPGTNHNDIGKTTFTVVCNDAGGYSIYAVGYGNFEVGNNKLIADFNGTPASTYDINTGTNTSGSPSSWAMKLTPSTNLTASNILNGYGSYSLVPTSYTKVVSLVPSTTVANPTSFEATYRVNIASNQPAGTYNGKVRYVMVNPANGDLVQPQATESGCIRYYANASTAVGTMGCQPVSTSDTSITLLASNYNRENYGFAGWSDAYDYATNANAHLYGPNEDIAFEAGQYTGSNPGLSLYAIWIKSAGLLQDSSKVAELCGNGADSLIQAGPAVTPTLASVSALTDKRDNQTYAIAKLADGKCWMIENLRLEAEDTTSAEDIISAQGYGTSSTYGNFTGLPSAEIRNFSTTNPPVPNSLYGADGSTVNTIQGGNSSYYYARIPRYNHYNTSSRAINPTSNNFNFISGENVNGGMYSFGNFYTWPAAIASIKQYSSPTASVEGATSETANTSICPTGWRLPYGRNTGNGTSPGGFSYLDIELGGSGNSTFSPTGAERSKTWRSFPNNFVYSGYFEGNTATLRGDEGRYWSSTAYNNYTSAYYFQLATTVIRPGTGAGDRRNGSVIRCVLNN